MHEIASDDRVQQWLHTVNLCVQFVIASRRCHVNSKQSPNRTSLTISVLPKRIASSTCARAPVSAPLCLKTTTRSYLILELSILRSDNGDRCRAATLVTTTTTTTTTATQMLDHPSCRSGACRARETGAGAWYTHPTKEILLTWVNEEGAPKFGVRNHNCVFEGQRVSGQPFRLQQIVKHTATLHPCQLYAPSTIAAVTLYSSTAQKRNINFLTPPTHPQTHTHTPA